MLTDEERKTAEQKALDTVTKIINDSPVLKNLFRSPRYRFWTNKKTKDQYFYTTEKINHKGKPRYVAGIYRFIKYKKAYALRNEVGFAKKKDAIAKAYKSYQDSLKGGVS